MKKIFAVGLVVILTGVFAFSYSKFYLRAAMNEPEVAAAVPSKPGKTMKPFASEEALKEHFRKIAEEQVRRQREANKTTGTSNSPASPSPASSLADGVASNEAKAGKDSKEDDDGITNNQTAGVDEGGIVKVHGDHLVILRRGRLFTVRVGSNSLAPVSSVNAYAPGVNPSNDWYDEMLVSKNTVVVIGYSYGRGGTEINLFDINSGGGLNFRSSYHLKSNDYYSSRNYASRLIGDKLVFYTPQVFWILRRSDAAVSGGQKMAQGCDRWRIQNGRVGYPRLPLAKKRGFGQRFIRTTHGHGLRPCSKRYDL
ncbi:MAG: beta-propeller domain-containing protein [Pyrinomonadaceae bacterium]